MSVAFILSMYSPNITTYGRNCEPSSALSPTIIGVAKGYSFTHVLRLSVEHTLLSSP